MKQNIFLEETDQFEIIIRKYKEFCTNLNYIELH